MKLDLSVLDRTESRILSLRSLYREYGYKLYRMGKFEEYDLYSRNKSFLVSGEVITFTDTSGRLMALKPDVTLSIIKNTRDSGQTLQKLCYNESVYRVSGKTRSFREIMQTGIECMGKLDAGSIGSVLMLAAKTLELLSDKYVLEVSMPDILALVISGISADGDARERLFKCAGEKNIPEIRRSCAEIGADSQALTELIAICDPPEDAIRKLRSIKAISDIGKEIELLSDMLKVFKDTAYDAHIQVDFSSVCDMNYYNGVIFQGYIGGIPESVLSGGRYDKLMCRMGRSDEAIGFAVYLDRIERLEEDAL